MPTSPADRSDLAVIGAGPAGLAAAVAAADAGLRVDVIDGGARLGGQYYRHPPASVRAERPGALYRDWGTFTALAARLARHREHGLITHHARHQVWAVERGERFVVHALHDDEVRQIATRTLLVATGAYDRSLPFPGWDLPGVFTAGGAQALLKGNLVLAGRRAVVAGTGPFLLPVAAGLADAGADVVAVHEANLPTGFARHAGALARNPDKLGEAAHYARVLARHRVPYRIRSGVVAAHGTDAVEAVTVALLDRSGVPVAGSERTVACDTLATGFGFVPQLEIPLQLGCACHTDADGSLVVGVDGEQATSVPGVYAAGEVTGVGGAPLALVEGELAGVAVARALGRTPPYSRAHLRQVKRRRRSLRAFALALHRVYRVPPGWTAWLRDDTLVCRCEEVPHARIAEAVRDLGATDPRSVKLQSRVGMGWCQGRICGWPAACITARLTRRDVTEADLRGLAHRPLGQPVPLRALAAVHKPDSS